MTFAARVSDALRRRLYPNTPLHLPQLAGAIGKSASTMERYWRGETRIPGEAIADMAAFFAKRGDRAFLAEVYGSDALPRSEPSRVVGDLMGQIAALAGHDRFLWFSDTGSMHEAAAGHADFVRRHLNMPLHAPGDMAAYAMRNLGWVAVELRRDRSAVVRYHDSGVDVTAAGKAAAWLLNHSPPLHTVRRCVDLGTRIVEITDRDGDAAAAALTRAAQIARITTRVPWRVERLPLDAAPNLLPIIAAHNEAPSRIVETAARMGKLSGCSLLRVSGTNVETVNVGSDVPCPHKGEFVGQNVFARADTAYAAVLHSHMIGATEGATLHWLRGSIFGRPVSYMRAALYAGPETGLVLSAPILRPSEEALSDARVCG